MTAPAVRPPVGAFSAAVNRARTEGQLVVQPRMGFPTVAQMREGLLAVRDARARTVGTITLDSYTRVGDHDSARRALADGSDINGFPIVAHGAEVTGRMLDGVVGDDFAVQVRHGSANPFGIVETLLDAGLDATEGGPVSYCLPYSRTPLAEAVDHWARSCALLAERSGGTAHLESFGGCLLGQLCPPGLLVAMAVLEGLFFRQHGLRSISLSYAQQTHFDQDVEALAALRRLAAEYLSDTDWHVVLYTYMGVFPRSTPGALALLRTSARLAARTGTERMIVKTPAEAHRIPTVLDNIQALEEAAGAARPHAPGGSVGPGPRQPAVPTPNAETADPVSEFGVLAEARALVEAVRELSPDIGRGLVEAFRRGYLDVPYCLHSDNAQRSRSFIDARGSLQWHAVGTMPIRAVTGSSAGPLRADDLLGMLSYVQEGFDRTALAPGRAGGIAGVAGP